MKINWWVPSCVVILLWWAVIFPELAITEDSCKIVDEQGKIIELSEERKESLYQELLQADPSQIRVKSAFWEWLTNASEDEKEENQNTMKKQARITVTGIQTIDGESLTTKSETLGFCEKTDETYLLTYNEETEDGTVSNCVSVNRECVRVSKRGAVEADMEFVPGKVRTFGYKTVQGEIPFVASGGRIGYNDDVCAFHTEFDYTLSIGDFVQECTMKIEAKYV